MSKSIIKDMAYRQSLMKYAENMPSAVPAESTTRSWSYVYFWRKARWDGSVASLASASPGGPTAIPISTQRRNGSCSGACAAEIQTWVWWSCCTGYIRRMESLFRVMSKLGLFPPKEKKPACKQKPYQQMTYHGQRI